MIVFDANVILDYIDENRAGHQDARDLISAAKESGHMCVVPSSALPTVYYLNRAAVRTHLLTQGWDIEEAGIHARDAAWVAMEILAHGCDIVEVNSEDVATALGLRSVHDDFEDNLIIAAALRCGGKAIATSDAKLIAHSPLKAGAPARIAALIRADAL